MDSCSPLSRYDRLDRVVTTTSPELLAPTVPSARHSVSGRSELGTCCRRYAAAAARLERCSLEVMSADSILLLPGGGRAPTLSPCETRLPALRETGDSVAAPAFVVGDGLDSVAEEQTAGDGLDTVAEEQAPQGRQLSGRVEAAGGCW